MVEQAGGGAMQAILAIIAVAEAIGMPQRAVPGVPDAAILILDMQVDGDLANVVQQCGIGRRGRPGFCLRGLVFRCCAGRQQMRLPQFEREGDDLQPMIEHAAEVSVVVASCMRAPRSYRVK